MASEREEPSLSEKEMEIIAVGASVASGCLPCTKFHLRVAASSGANTDEIQGAVREAIRVRLAATEIMAKAGGLPPDAIPHAAPLADGDGSLIRHLVAISAASTIRCATSLETHIGAARALGASNRQLAAALEIARRIKAVAGQKAKSVAAAAMGLSEDELGACGCGSDSAQKTDSAPCSCGSDQGAAPEQKGNSRC